ncbi:MAG TPA: PLP-dependent aminotransferase family protein [Thermoanaerobaculia bacterium]|nr:PLP-dependent aminotransferase family protein [Thermoanaerobaculia bacterium]
MPPTQTWAAGPSGSGYRSHRVGPKADGGTARLREILERASRPGVISFAVGLPALELLPVHELAAAQGRVLPGLPAALQYAVSYAPLRRQIVDLMAARGVECGPEQVFLTSGAQQGMDLLARLLVESGDHVLLEETVYEGIQLALRGRAPRLLTVPTDPETGLQVSAVERWLEGGMRPAMLYTIPDGHNPLGVSQSAGTRRRLIELARDFAFPVVEDDAYGLLYYGEAPPPPLRALDGSWAFYLGSFSKILAPALRAGWMVVPEELVPQLSVLKHAADLDTPSLSQRIISAYLEAGGLAAHLEMVRAEYRRRRDVMLGCLAAALPPSVRWTRPRSGMFIWVELPREIDAAALLEEAITSEGVAFSPGEVFAVGGSRHADHCLRLCFTTCPPDQIAEGIERLGRVVERALGPGGASR